MLHVIIEKDKENKYMVSVSILIFAVIGALIAVVGFIFYWYMVKPDTIRKECINSSLYNIKNQNMLIDVYKACLEKRGLNN